MAKLLAKVFRWIVVVVVGRRRRRRRLHAQKLRNGNGMDYTQVCLRKKFTH